MEQFWLTFISLASLHFLSVISPGPDFVLVTGNALLYQRRTAVYTALGISLGILVHVSYCVLGLAVIIAHSLWIFSIIKYLGALYLFYLGLKAILAKSSTQSNTEKSAQKKSASLSDGKAVKQGFLCNVLNPKVTIFFLGIFSLIIRPDTPIWQQVFFGIWICVVTFIWFAALACFMTHPHFRTIVLKVQPFVTKVMGVMLVLFGIALVFF